MLLNTSSVGLRERGSCKRSEDERGSVGTVGKGRGLVSGSHPVPCRVAAPSVLVLGFCLPAFFLTPVPPGQGQTVHVMVVSYNKILMPLCRQTDAHARPASGSSVLQHSRLLFCAVTHAPGS